MEFTQGNLYIRLRDGIISELFYPKENAPDGWKKVIVETLGLICQGSACPTLAQEIETVPNGCKTGAGTTITYRQATDRDLDLFVKSWLDHAGNGISEWIERVKAECTDMTMTEKQRLLRVTKPYYW
jgi:hypothetical protein